MAADPHINGVPQPTDTCKTQSVHCKDNDFFSFGIVFSPFSRLTAHQREAAKA